MTIVDIHCHTFNADDLPVKGFVKRVAGNHNALVRVLSRAIDKVVQGMADNVASELAALNALLASDGLEEGIPEDVMGSVARQADLLLAEITAEDPVSVAEATVELAAESAGEEGLEGPLDMVGAIKRNLSWAALFGKRRLALTRALVQTYPEVDLFTPLLVDLLGLEDQPKSTMLQQLEINAKISQLGMRGDLGAAVHPFVGFDPRRVGAVPLAKTAVENWGCVGVKMYPLMGFRPLGNVVDPPRGMSAEEAIGVEDALRQLYEWCEAENVPITAHSNPSNQAHDDFLTFSQPANWELVLRKHPHLHLNLGHFGWGGLADGWPQAICRLANEHEHLYADIGNHELGDLSETFDQLVELFDDSSADTSIMKKRFMFGTDWFMVASHEHYKEFLHRFRDEYTARFPTGVDDFMGNAAISFLGFDDPGNRNNTRLRDRYASFGFPAPDWLRT